VTIMVSGEEEILGIIFKMTLSRGDTFECIYQSCRLRNVRLRAFNEMIQIQRLTIGSFDFV